MASGRSSAKDKNDPIISQSFNKPFNYAVSVQMMMKALVFEGLTDASWISRPLKGLDRSIRHQEAYHLPLWAARFASLLLENGVDIYTIKSLMGHTKRQNHADLYAHRK